MLVIFSRYFVEAKFVDWNKRSMFWNRTERAKSESKFWNGYFKYKHRTLELWRTKLVQEVFKEDGECSDTRRSLYSRWNLLWIAAPSIRKRAIEVSRHYIVKQRILIIASAYSLHTHFCFHSVNYWFCKQCLCLQTEILVHFLKKPMKITRICLIFLQGNIEANFTYTAELFI